MHSAPLIPPARTRGFTLVEIMVATTIMGLCVLGVLKFTIQALNIYYYDSGRLLVNRDIRSFTEQMTTNAVYSNYFRLYQNFSTTSVTNNGTTTEANLNDGQSGDFLVLVTANTDPASGITLISQLVGYYRDPSTTTNTGPVRTFTATINPAVNPAVTPIYSLISTYAPASTQHTNPIVVQLAQGLSNGTLFYNFKDHSVMVRGQIIEQGNETTRAVNTYNFTVSPRG